MHSPPQFKKRDNMVANVPMEIILNAMICGTLSSNCSICEILLKTTSQMITNAPKTP